MRATAALSHARRHPATRTHRRAHVCKHARTDAHAHIATHVGLERYVDVGMVLCDLLLISPLAGGCAHVALRRKHDVRTRKVAPISRHLHRHSEIQRCEALDVLRPPHVVPNERGASVGDAPLHLGCKLQGHLYATMQAKNSSHISDENKNTATLTANTKQARSGQIRI